MQGAYSIKNGLIYCCLDERVFRDYFLDVIPTPISLFELQVYTNRKFRRSNKIYTVENRYVVYRICRY